MPKDKIKETKGDTKPEGLHWFVKRMVAVFATFFVVVGVASVGLLARDTMPQPDLNEQEATSTAVYASGFMVVNEETASLHKMNGEWARNLEWPKDTSIFSKAVSQLTGIDMISGESVWLENDFKVSTSTRFRSPDGRREARLEQERRDGSAPLIISYGNDKDVRILRSMENKMIKDIELIGWAGDKRFVFAGNATGTMALFVLDLGGGVNYLAPISEFAWNYRIFEKDIYFIISNVTSSADGGEDLKSAPSFLHKISLSGDKVDLLQVDDSVIQSYTVSEKTVVYALADQSMYKKTGDNETAMGKCMPFMLLSSGEVICRLGNEVLLKADGTDSVRLFDTKDGALFYLEKVRMDEPAQNE